ncbi:Osmotically-inducible protein OsmY, contains BON domain [Pasteurella testudinis DSM 23072]|uniref:Osmotically-inducible protein OsmY, contains BON domain n=1 Tax=Pasteurella testudinis DSM 23072 TaxID=1122938 RepID=A0A1W1UJ10_9PAST|nr:division/outer membrane stress-associated lipid-binding lipoprotein [Pasteurella testudinis]SMB80791.1 Osmotically-inducible protein OsmY, contains BON domain [Pasteurella testudinis DSM 23072]SUB52307.1 putative transport-associated protein [Pasteurella testudinis]
MPRTTTASRLIKLSILLLGAFGLQACVTTAVVGTAAVATKVATDPRTAGTQIDDETLEVRVSSALNKDAEIKEDARINVVSYNSRVLLIGQVPSESLKETAKNLASGVDGVTDVYNEIRVGEKIGFGQISQDTWITTRIKSKLLLNSAVKSTDVKVITENGEVFLMGSVTEAQANAAAEDARYVGGVTKVIKVFSYIN